MLKKRQRYLENEDSINNWGKTKFYKRGASIKRDKERIIEMIKEFKPNGDQRNVFGDGKASERIIEIINKYETNDNKDQRNQINK